MKRQRVAYAAASLVVVLISVWKCQASVTLSLSTADDLSALGLGESVTINVDLSGLVAGDELEFLAATITFDDAVFGTPTAINPGAVIPDVTGFFASAFPGIADGLFDALFSTSGDPITTNGTFYSFDLTVVGTGSGVIGFDFVDAQLVADLPDPTPVDTGAALAFSTVGGGVIPEPASALIWPALFAAAGILSRFRSSMRTDPTAATKAI
jgi:hypothetical protein